MSIKAYSFHHFTSPHFFTSPHPLFFTSLHLKSTHFTLLHLTLRQLIDLLNAKVKKGIEIKSENDLVYSALAVLFKEEKTIWSGRRPCRRARPCAPLEPARGGE
jgi:hypothetical protein